ncbi:hypothetical protein ASPVEDRAFT_157993 [Aspergillus versicolor CBS 583.65]|uniref:Heterokaryon incompatibility domain-containing protein n=1 Tax=Aspergillus versicolor CBS 583.65 TaxID=1036611 RepID=A0A1L9P4W9_ASPVE|nr:uncharacterized protein ASPVEDRAFT_157993 [Aspergillus versicolor CBS 583.65]OJI96463.1 hypothetical protein ASPVEDRAFT_157993 [Aspergillus versicolor CBS 583.65]
MLCDKCSLIQFDFCGTAGRPKDFSYYILHKDHDSFLNSVASGCHLCNLIKGQLNTKHEDQTGDDQLLKSMIDSTNTNRNAICAYFKAYMIIMAELSPSNQSIQRLSITSQTGQGDLKAIDPLLEPYSQVCQLGYRSIGSGSQGLPLDGARLEHAHSAQRCRDSGSESVSGEIRAPDGTALSPVPLNIGLACLWIDHCLQNHEYCKFGYQQYKVMGDRVPPTLLINVSTPDRPFLESTTATTIRTYLALSYCWGIDGNLKTLNENYQTHEKLIPVESLPRTVRDAIDVTRWLGCQYLWVDALCIIQDNTDMRDKELGRMGDIYRQAFLTIYAERGRTCTDGLFENRDPLLYRPCQLTWLEKTAGGAATTTNTTLTVSLPSVNHLQNRGWILQEEVLSSRRLIFGNQMAWACTVATALETRPVPKDERDPVTSSLGSSLSRLRMRLFAPQLTGSALGDIASSWTQRRDNFDAWYCIVEDYSGRNLTFDTDKLPALGGLAASFARVQATTYLAGLWKEDIQIGLGWYVATEQATHNLENTEASGPTWSWASAGKMRVRFRYLEPDSAHLVSKGSHVVNASCAPQSLHQPYGRIQNGYIELRGSLKRLSLKYSPESSLSDLQKEIMHRESEFKVDSLIAAATNIRARFPGLILDPGTGKVVGMAALDRPPQEAPSPFHQTQTPQHATEEKSERQIWCLLLSVFERSYMDGTLLYLTCLILEFVDDAKFVFRRCGLGVLDDNAWSPTELPDIYRDDSVQPQSVRNVTIV